MVASNRRVDLLAPTLAWDLPLTTAPGAREALAFIDGLVGAPTRIDDGVALWSLAANRTG